MHFLAFGWLALRIKRWARPREGSSWGLLWGYCKAVLWRVDNAVSGGIVTIATLSKISPQSPFSWTAIGLMVLAALIWALLRLGWIEYCKNNSLVLRWEKFHLSNSFPGIQGTAILIFGKITNRLEVQNQADKWKLTYTVPGAAIETATQHDRDDDIDIGNNKVIKTSQRLDVKAFSEIPKRKAIRGYLIFTTKRIEIPVGTLVTLSFEDVSGALVQHSAFLSGTKPAEFEPMLGLEFHRT